MNATSGISLLPYNARSLFTPPASAPPADTDAPAGDHWVPGTNDFAVGGRLMTAGHWAPTSGNGTLA